MVDNLPVIREGAGIDEDIIHIAYHFAIVDELTEDVVYHHLECCGGVTQSKEHDSWFKQPSVGLECHLPLFTLFDLHIVKSPAEVKYSEELSVAEAG